MNEQKSYFSQTTKMNSNLSTEQAERKKTIKIIIISLVIIISFFIGLVVGISNSSEMESNNTGTSGKVTNQGAKPPEYLSKNVNFKLFWQVWDLIKDKYVEEDVNEVNMFYGAQMGLLASLEDPYSVFLVPEIAENFNEELKGKFEGIGAEIAIKKDRLTIVAPLPESPAEKAGLRAGDKVLAIDDLDTSGMSLARAVNLIRGDKGTEVVLTVMHKDGNQEKIVVIRDKIQYASVKYKLLEDDTIGYIQVSYFNEDTEGLFNEAVNNMVNKNIDKIILDLRNNPGGFLSTAISMANNWIEDGVIVKEKSRDATKNKSFSASGQAKFKDKKTVVLVNGGSASASEIVSGALQDYGLATIIGETTFGKGSVQDLTELSDGSSVKLTIAKWYTPNDRSINLEGIIPDVKIELSAEDYNNDLDPQLEKAIEILK
jgi:carboxyl-terminal processing protease